MKLYAISKGGSYFRFTSGSGRHVYTDNLADAALFSETLRDSAIALARKLGAACVQFEGVPTPVTAE